MQGHKPRTECERCGTCCTKGGPALHYGDSKLLQNNWLNPEHLITIRKGEPVFTLDSGKPEPAQSEIIKIKGKGNNWTCLFFDPKNAYCSIYEHRPIECSLLKCWNTGELEKMAGKNLLSRHDIISPGDPILPFIKTHGVQCSLENLGMQLLAVNNEKSRQQAINELEDLVNADLAIRSQAYTKFRFSLALELFFFGRPLFKILDQFGIRADEKNGVCVLSLAS